MITCSVFTGENRNKYGMQFVQIRSKKSWLISIQKSAFISIQPIQLSTYCVPDSVLGSFCFCRGRRCCALDFLVGLNNSFAINRCEQS